MTFKAEEELLAELESSANAMPMEVDAGYSFQQFLFALEPTQVKFTLIVLTFRCLTPVRSLTNVLLWRMNTRLMNCALSRPCKVRSAYIRIPKWRRHLASPHHLRRSSVFTPRSQKFCTTAVLAWRLIGSTIFLVQLILRYKPWTSIARE